MSVTPDARKGLLGHWLLFVATPDSLMIFMSFSFFFADLGCWFVLLWHKPHRHRMSVSIFSNFFKSQSADSRRATTFFVGLFVFALSLPFILKNHPSGSACPAVQTDCVSGHLGPMQGGVPSALNRELPEFRTHWRRLPERVIFTRSTD